MKACQTGRNYADGVLFPVLEFGYDSASVRDSSAHGILEELGVADLNGGLRRENIAYVEPQNLTEP
jgi:hypothetical protein